MTLNNAINTVVKSRNVTRQEAITAISEAEEIVGSNLEAIVAHLTSEAVVL